MRLSCLLLVLAGGTASAQPAPGVLAHGIFTATITAEVDASKDTFGDPTSIAPDVAIAASDRLTFSLIHSTFGRTGFRGGAGAGICITDRCAKTYDNAGGEVYVGLLDGVFAVAANGGFHALSFDGELYAAKLGARMRYLAGPLSLVSLPSVAIAITERDASPDRVFVPLNLSAPVRSDISLGLITGFKSTLDDIEATYEIAAGAFVTYQATPSLGFAASWVHGKIIGGEAVVPDGTSGVDSRALQIWVTITRSAYPRYR